MSKGDVVGRVTAHMSMSLDGFIAGPNAGVENPLGDRGVAEEMHHRSHDLCFIARSVNFPVKTEPEFLVAMPPLSGDSTDDAQPVNTDVRCS
jgi:hypothetical protein